MLFAPCLHPVQEILLHGRMPGIQLHQMFLVPVIGHMVVHRDLFPDPVCHKIDRVFMPRLAAIDPHASRGLVIAPALSGNLLFRRSVIDLPICQGLQ